MACQFLYGGKIHWSWLLLFEAGSLSGMPRGCTEPALWGYRAAHPIAMGVDVSSLQHCNVSSTSLDCISLPENTHTHIHTIPFQNNIDNPEWLKLNCVAMETFRGRRVGGFLS